MKDINDLKEKVYKCAISHGWHDKQYSDEHFLCLVISELMEAIDADRNDKHAKVCGYFKGELWKMEIPTANDDVTISKFKENYELYIKGTVEEELADAVIRMMDFAGMKQSNLTDGLEVVCPMKNISLTEFCYRICSLITNPDKSTNRWVNENVNVWIALIKKWCIENEIDIMWHIIQKMRYNELRPYKHGGKKY